MPPIGGRGSHARTRPRRWRNRRGGYGRRFTFGFLSLLVFAAVLLPASTASAVVAPSNGWSGYIRVVTTQTRDYTSPLGTINSVFSEIMVSNLRGTDPQTAHGKQEYDSTFTAPVDWVCGPLPIGGGFWVTHEQWSAIAPLSEDLPAGAGLPGLEPGVAGSYRFYPALLNAPRSGASTRCDGRVDAIDDVLAIGNYAAYWSANIPEQTAEAGWTTLSGNWTGHESIPELGYVTTSFWEWSLTKLLDRDHDGVPDDDDNCPDFFNPEQVGDSDSDGLADGPECSLGTDPSNPDTDADGLSDGDEVHTYNTDPLAPDTDGDGLPDGTEVHTYNTSPLDPDTDGDGDSDGEEVANGTDPLDPTDPGGGGGSDVDGDGVPDGSDNCPTVANADQSNIDRDQFGDVCDDDIDGDGLPNAVEVMIGTNVFDTDSDDDFVSDGEEFRVGSDPTDRLSTPANLPPGVPPGVTATGAVGITCGVAKFDWYTSVGNSRAGVQRGEQACILLLGNGTSAEALNEALSPTGQPLTNVLADLITPWLKEKALDALLPGVNFEMSIPWSVRKAIIRQLNLTRFNTFFTLGELIGLNGAGLLAATIITEIRAHDACIQVSIGPDGSSLGLDWNIVFNNLRVTSKSDYTAGAHEKKVRPFKPDTYEKRLSNLSCVNGSVQAKGGAGTLFDDNFPVLTNVG